MENSKKLKKLLITRLDQAGMERSLIPGFIRSLANSVFIIPHVNLWDVNERLQYLGWDNFKLDYHTFELAMAFFDAEGLHCLENIKDFMFDKSFLNGTFGMKKSHAVN